MMCASPPHLPIISELVAGGALVRSFDPIAGEAAQRALGIGLDLAPDLDQALRGAQAVLVLTRWEEFNELPRLLAALPEPPVLIDARRMLDRDAWPRYEGIGFSRKRVLDQNPASQRHELASGRRIAQRLDQLAVIAFPWCTWLPVNCAELGMLA